MVVAVLSAACASHGPGTPRAHAGGCVPCDAALAGYVGASPSKGRLLGLHEYDGKVADYSREGIGRRIAAARRDLETLTALDRHTLSPDAAVDIDVMGWALREELFGLEERALWQTDPSFYLELFAVNDYADRDGAPASVRLDRLLRHEEAALRQTSHIYENLRLPLSKPVAGVAADRVAGYAEYLRGSVHDRMLEGADSATAARFEKTNGALAAEAERLSEWLRREVIPHGDESHVLGRDRFERLVALYAGKPIPLATFKRMGEEDLLENRAAYDALAKTVEVRRPREADYLSSATRLMNEARAFVVDRGIVTLAADDRVVVRESPPYMRYNQAWIETYGPFETERSTSFFDITMPDPSWPSDKREGYIMTFGDLRVTVAHEVYPGHFVQLRWLARAPTRVQKHVVSFAFHEGWAHYVEQMMIDEGFGRDDAEARLGQLSDALLRNCRVVVAIGVHTEGMSLKDAEERFVRDCAQDRALAREQALRATFDPWYFAYTLGKLQILQLREEARTMLGPSFSLRRFHDALLAHGEPPLGLLRERVLHDLAPAGNVSGSGPSR
jgi:uncharacterized protein (DUF885 family)